MRTTIKKMPVADVTALQALVVEHADGIEPGLSVLDSRMLLGDATIDVVGCDVNASLVLIVVGLTADEAMLLRAVDAYSWCLEYPDAMQRLYPSVAVSAERPPRVVFAVQRVPDTFHRKVKQLSMPEVDCVELQHVSIDGTATVYFDVVARLRRGAAAALAAMPAAASAAEQPGLRRLAQGSEPGVTENVIPLNGAAARAASHRLQRPAHQHGEPAARPLERPAASATVISMPVRAAVAHDPVAEAFARLEAITHAEAVEAAVPVEALTPIEVPADINLADLAALLESMPTPFAAPIPAAAPAPPAPVEAASAPGPEPAAAIEPARAVSFAEAAKDLLGKPAAAPAAFVEPAAAAGLTLPPSPFAAPRSGNGTVKPAAALSPLSKPIAPARAAAAGARPAARPTPASVVKVVERQAQPAAPAQPIEAANLPKGFEGLQLPNDGVLTRQWMDFLNQMAAPK